MTIRSPIRSPIRSLVSSAFGGGGGLLSQATSQLGGVAPYHYWDFINNRALFAQADVGGVTSTPGWSFTRASTGYAETAAGVLVPFASGELRRTDKGVLIEGARTNLCLRSQEFDNASWTKTRATVTANAIAAPDGTVTADKIVEDSSGSTTHFLISALYTITADATFCVSGFFKAGERSWVHLRGSDSTETNAFGKYFDLASGAVGSNTAGGTGGVSSSGIRALADGWYFCWVVGSVASSVTSVRSVAKMGTANNTQGYTGDGASGLYCWGMQAEAAAFPSSYIPTTTASATRAADVLTVSSPGVNYPLGMYAEFERVVDTGNFENTLGVDDGTSNNRTLLFLDTSDRVAASARTATVEQLNIPVTGAVAIGAATKSAIRMDTNNAIAARGGTLSALDNTVTLPANPTRVTFSPSQELFGYLRRAAIFNFAPSDAQLQAMTT